MRNLRSEQLECDICIIGGGLSGSFAAIEAARAGEHGRGFAVVAGLEQIVEYVKNLHFDEEDIAYLKNRNLFSKDFLDYLRDFRFTGDIWAVPEGTPVFPNEPILTVRAPAIQAQFIETFILLTINHQSLIATKASRICRAADGRAVLEFGSRRAQGADGAVLGARAAYIAGALNAERLIMMTDIAGVLRDKDDPSTLIPAITVSEAKGLYEEGVISGGMIPKVKSAVDALNAGVRKVHFIDGRLRHTLLLEIFTPEGIGTEIVREQR